MGIAINSSKLGLAYLVDGELMDWKVSTDVIRNEETAFEQAQKWIGFYELNAVVLEALEDTRKGERAHRLQQAVVRAADLLGVPVVFGQRGAAANKYAAAAALADEFPQVAPWLPEQPKLWEKEPRFIILFEALSLAWTWWRSPDAQGQEEATIEF